MITIKSKQTYDHPMVCQGLSGRTCAECGGDHASGWTITRTLTYDHDPDLYCGPGGEVEPECMVCHTTHPPTSTTELWDLLPVLPGVLLVLSVAAVFVRVALGEL